VTPLLLAALVVTQAVVVATWHRCLGVPGGVGGAAVAGAAAVAADVLVLDGAGDQPLSSVPAVLALAVLAALVHQLARRDGRDRLTASLTATVSLAALAALGSAYVASLDVEHGPGLVSTAGVAAALVVAGVFARRRSGASNRYDIVVVPAAGAASAVVMVALEGLEVGPALAVAGVSALVAWVATVLVARAPGSGSREGAALGAALPILVAGPAAYVLGRLLVG